MKKLGRGKFALVGGTLIAVVITVFYRYEVLQGLSSSKPDISIDGGQNVGEDQGRRRVSSTRKSKNQLTSEFLSLRSDPKAVCSILEELLTKGVFSDPDIYEIFIDSLPYYSDEQLAQVLNAWETVLTDERYSELGSPSGYQISEGVWKMLIETGQDTEVIFQRSAAICEELTKGFGVKSFLIRNIVREMPEFLPKHLDKLLLLELSAQEELDVTSKLVGRLGDIDVKKRLTYAETFLTSGLENRAVRQALVVEVIEAEFELGDSLRSIGEWLLEMDNEVLAGADGKVVWKSLEHGDYETASWFLGELVRRDRKERKTMETMLGNFIKKYMAHDPNGLSDWSNKFALEHEDFKEFVTNSTSEALKNAQDGE